MKRRNHIKLIYTLDGEKYINDADAPVRPGDWPIDDFERMLDDTVCRLRTVRRDGTAQRNITFPDIEKAAQTGVTRKTGYTAHIINSIYIFGLDTGQREYKALSYRILKTVADSDGEKTEESRTPVWRDELLSTLWFFYSIYDTYRKDGDEYPFGILLAAEMDNTTGSEDIGMRLSGIYNSIALFKLLLDLSGIAPCPELPFIDFTRDELKEIIFSFRRMCIAYPGFRKFEEFIGMMLDNLLTNAHFEQRDRHNYIKVFMRAAFPEKPQDDIELW